MGRITRILDKAGSELVNGVNAGNPDHQHIESLGFSEYEARAHDDIETFGRLTMKTGAVITAGALALEAIMHGTEVAHMGVGLGLGGVAVGAVVYGFSKLPN